MKKETLPPGGGTPDSTESAFCTKQALQKKVKRKKFYKFGEIEITIDPAFPNTKRLRIDSCEDPGDTWVYLETVYMYASIFDRGTAYVHSDGSITVEGRRAGAWEKETKYVTKSNEL